MRQISKRPRKNHMEDLPMNRQLYLGNRRTCGLCFMLAPYHVFLLCCLSMIVGPLLHATPLHASHRAEMPSIWIGTVPAQQGERVDFAAGDPSQHRLVAKDLGAPPKLISQTDIRLNWLERELHDFLISAGKGNFAGGLIKMGRSFVSQAGQPGEPLALPWLTTLFPRFDIPPWMKRIDLDIDLQGHEGPIYSIRTRQPLFQSLNRHHTLFTQVRWGKIYQLGQWRDTTNLGVGYRRLLHDRTILLGANAFYDRDWRKDHNRIGAGLEARWFGVDVYVNGYWGISADHSVNATTKEKVLDGWDAYLLLQVPYIPSMRLTGRVFQWDTRSGNNWDGWSAGLEADVTPFAQLQAGATDSDRDRLAAFVQLRINFGYYENRPVLLSKHPFSREAWRMRDMSGYTLDRVRRQETIVLEQIRTTPGGTGGITIVVGRS